ncbi:MAG: helix-turn-helix domain-containing protein [Puniceicoccales bacterium]|jgi:transcriptional regulator with XRE-family HTH domain|nr:helix-turn-helix domain-containing protein [Puniceicoccales bacterium]
MSSSIGKILSEKRLELGLALEEVANTTRIRVDYLEAIEQDQLDFNLPDIYKRGFIKAYAEHLGLDIGEVMKACPIPSYEALVSNEKRRGMVSTVARKQAAYVAIEAEAVDEDMSAEHDRPSEVQEEHFSYRKIGIITAVVVVFLATLVGIFHLSPKHAKPSKSVSSPALSFEKIAPHREILLRAKGAVKLIVRDRDSKERIYTGSLQDGEERYIEYEKPIQVYYDRGELLSLEMANGEILHPDKGRGGIEIK